MSDPVEESFRRLRMQAALRDGAAGDGRVEALDARLTAALARWDDAPLTDAVAHVLSDAFRAAGRREDPELARSVAPHVVGTIKREILNSQAELIEALSPRVGELIRKAVGEAIADLQRQIDEALPVELWIAQIKARLTGASALAHLVEAEDHPFRVEEAYLIERGSGLLLARETPATLTETVAIDDDLVAGMIAALDSFVSDAFGENGFGTLRRIETEAGTVYLRASARKILALRCSGVAPPDVERRIDLLLERTIERAQSGEMIIDPTPLLAVEETALKRGVHASGLVLRAVGAVAAVLALIAMHGWLEAANAERWRSASEAAIAALPAFAGYPVAVRLEDGPIVAVEGLAPDAAAAAAAAMAARRSAGPLPVRIALPVAGRRLAQ